MLRLAALATALTLFGCDASQTDPTFARIESVTVQNAPDDDNGSGLSAHLSTAISDGVRIERTDAEAGPFPLRLELPVELPVQTTDGPFEGATLYFELYQLCEAPDCTGMPTRWTAEIQPDAWPGTQRTVEVGGARVTLTYRRTTS